MKGFVYVLYLIITGILVGATRDQNEENEILRKLDHLTAVVKQLRLTVNEIELENKRLQNGYRKIVDTNNELRAEMHTIKGDADGQTVAFTAAVNRILTLGPNQAVQFEKIITNVGNAYDPRHGHMIVPVKGLYLISVTLFNKVGDSNYIELVKNGNPLVYFYDYGGQHSPMSQTIIVSLEKGDVVWVKNHDSAFDSGHHLLGSPTELYNTFSGFLLKSL